MDWWFFYPSHTVLSSIASHVIVNKASYAFAVIVITLAALITGLLIIRRQLDHLDFIAVLKTRE
jgi:hypothetical protein